MNEFTIGNTHMKNFRTDGENILAYGLYDFENGVLETKTLMKTREEARLTRMMDPRLKGQPVRIKVQIQEKV